MIAHGHALECKIASLIANGNEREIGGSTTDVDYQDRVSWGHQLAPFRMAFDPCIEGRLRFFEQHNLAKSRLRRSLLGELARDGIEGRRDGDEYLLLSERSL